MPEPPPSRLRQILQKPGARRRVGRAVASLLGTGLVTIGAIGALTIWHLVRRGRLIRERLGPPRRVVWIEPEPQTEKPAPPER